MANGRMPARCSWRGVHVYDAATQKYLGGCSPGGFDHIRELRRYAARYLVGHYRSFLECESL